MKRLTKNQKEIIKNFHSKGLSLRQIQKKTNIPLSTLQYNLNKNSGRKRTKELIIPESDFIIGELIGAFAGDGSFYANTNDGYKRYWIRFFLSYYDDKQYMFYLCKILKNMDLNPKIYIKKFNGKPSSFEIRVISINLYLFIKRYLFWEGKKANSVCLKDKISAYSNDFLFGFARGLMDTDGFIENNSIGFGVTSKRLVENLSEILSMIGICTNITIKKPKKENWREVYLIRTSKKVFLKIYSDKIGFSHFRKQKELFNLTG